MKRSARTRFALVAGAASIALLATGCSADTGASDSADGNVELTVATFNEFGYEDLFDDYEAANPNVTIVHKKAATTNEARDNLTTRLAAGSGLSDIKAIEVDWLPELLQYPDQFVDLAAADVDGRWLSWKTDAATTPDGELIGYGTVIATENPEIKAAYASVLGASSDLSAHLTQWSSDWTAGFQNNGFATMLCPGSMLGIIEGNSAGVTGWDIADTFPGGGGNWGGSYLTIPTQSAHPEEAQKLAAWLTAPEQQLSAFASKGTFPSQVDALESADLLESTDAFFNDAPTG